MQFSLALLFYNEEENVLGIVSGLKETLDSEKADYQLLLVNNGSTDRTPSLIRELTAHDPRLKTVTVEKNLGYGWGAIQGMKAAEGEWVGFMAGDGQVDPADVARLYRETRHGYDLVKVRRAYRQDGFIRGVISDVYVMTFCLLFDLPFYDINATPLVFRRKWLEKLDFRSRDWFLNAEIMLKARSLNLSIKEVTIVFRRRKGGKSNVRVATVFEFVFNILKFRLGRGLSQWKRKIGLKS
ncbi:MAG: glycosyltransferase family 2 protein [Candidatus Aureabacteria bacterium]|nr:glycosyltransferase family 2 protein [Candidatus Auribacterota bacterium]